jgi:hypothetical protein
MVTLTEFLSYRWHELPFDQIASKADIDRHVLRHIESLGLSCRRKVKAHVLKSRHYCTDYDKPELLKALDCSFKYTGRAYAFAKARNIYLAQVLPEVFFKKAGQKIRARQYAAWLRDHRGEFRDILRSLQGLPESGLTAFTGWADLERHSREWHARQIREAEQRFRRRHGVDTQPFDLPPDILRNIQHHGYAFTLLTSPEQMAQESIQMQHCIHSYASDVREGEYLAYRVEGNGERATLGLDKIGEGWAFDQVRGKFNALMSESLTHACREFVQQINRNLPNDVGDAWRLDGAAWHYIVAEKSVAQIVPNRDGLGRSPEIQWLTLVPDFDCALHAVHFSNLARAKDVIEAWWRSMTD